MYVRYCPIALRWICDGHRYMNSDSKIKMLGFYRIFGYLYNFLPSSDLDFLTYYILDRSLIMGWRDQAAGHSFQTSNLIFWKHVLQDNGKKGFFDFVFLDRSLIMGWREVTLKALKGLLSVVTLVFVCLYVCMYVIKLQVTVFDPVS